MTGCNSGDAEGDSVAIAEFVLTILEQTGERLVYVAEAEQAKVVHANVRSPRPQRLWRGTAGGTPALLAHHRGVLGLYFVNDAHFAGVAVGIFVDAEIFLGQLVDVSAGAFFGDLDHAAADFEVAVGILWVHQSHGYARVAADVLIFLASLGGVENDVLAVEVAPHGRNLRTAVGHQGAEVGESALLEQVAVFFGDGWRH